MNELSEFLVSSTTDITSAQPMKLTEQLIDNTVIQNELEKRKISLEQLHSKLQTITDQEELDSIKGLFQAFSLSLLSIVFSNLVFEEKLARLNEHWLIMRQANALQEENLLLTQTCAKQFWAEYHELSEFLDDTSRQLLEIRPCSTSREHIEHEQEKYNQLLKNFSSKQAKFQDILQQYSLQLLSFISNNQQETEDIQCCIHELEQKWYNTQTDFNTCQNQLSEARMKSTEFNTKLENVSTWFDETSSLTVSMEEDKNNDFEHIRTVKEHLDKKYLDIINLKQDYTDIQQEDGCIREEKANLVEEQFEEIDSKWTQLNDQVQEQ
jgi:hypothetical protein